MRNFHILSVIGVFVAVISVTVVSAALNTNLFIEGKAKVKVEELTIVESIIKKYEVNNTLG